MLQRMSDEGGFRGLEMHVSGFAMQNQWIYANNSAFCCTWIIWKKFFWSVLQFFLKHKTYF